LTTWGQQLVGLLTGKQLAIDGKQVRGTTPAGQKQANVQLVTMWVEAHRLTLAQQQVADESNEITAVPDLLKPLAI
jgi:hypothetical protein